MSTKRVWTLLALLLLAGCGGRDTAEKTVVVLEHSPAPVSSAPAPTPGADAASTPAPTAAPTPAAVPLTLPRDWYGWWKMDRCSGDWAKMYGYYWDCCARLETEGGQLRLLLWDEDLPIEKYLALLLLSEREGKLRCTAGSFLDRELSEDSVTVTRGEDRCGISWTLEGTYQAVGRGGFHYLIYLRPWGSDWPGSADEKPYYYESWYLPQIAAGAAMPEKIGG